jgi:hypothetical protein
MLHQVKPRRKTGWTDVKEVKARKKTDDADLAVGETAKENRLNRRCVIQTSGKEISWTNATQSEVTEEDRSGTCPLKWGHGGRLVWHMPLEVRSRRKTSRTQCPLKWGHRGKLVGHNAPWSEGTKEDWPGTCPLKWGHGGRLVGHMPLEVRSQRKAGWAHAPWSEVTEESWSDTMPLEVRPRRKTGRALRPRRGTPWTGYRCCSGGGGEQTTNCCRRSSW